MIGSRLGPYEITGKLGEGGMGEVYRATDSRLRREVAIKVLPAAFTEDKERLARFEREAQLLAQLHHTNIASIFGLEESGGVKALVMELVPGPTLAERLESGPLSFTEGFSFALQIAQALEEAHGKGIIHRDLKPQNIKASREGKLKVLDFGLAKAMEAPTGSASAADFARSPTIMNSPTLTAAHGTQLGVILGTAAYMAPEQARGASVDKRADIWAFGVVFHEMLTGRSLFAGDTVSDTLAGVLKTEIDWKALPAGTPLAIRQLLRRCLERNPKNRLHDIADARIVLEELASGKSEDSAPAAAIVAAAPQRSFASRWLPWALAAVASLAAILLAVGHVRAPRAAPPRLLRFQFAPPESTSASLRGSGFELSADGRFFAIATAGELWVRALDEVAFRRLEGITEATYPFWSPDGAWIGFFAQGQLKRVARDGGPAQKICDAPDGRGAAWGADSTIVFSAGPGGGGSGLARVSAQGGQPIALTHVPAGGVNQYHRYPQFLPGGRSFLFQFLTPSPELAGIYLASLDGGEPERVLEGRDQALYAPSPDGSPAGHLLFRREFSLMAQAFDPARRKVSGEPIPIADGVGGGGNTGSGAFAVSTNGLLAWSADLLESSELVWIDRAGKKLEAVLQDTREVQGLALAPGGRRLAFGVGRPSDIWIQSLPGGTPSRFTFGQAPGWAYPIWSPDGAELIYTTFDLVGFAQYEIRRRRADRAGGEETLVSAKTVLYPWDWSPDGGSLLYSDDPADLWLLPLTGERKAVPFLVAPGRQSFAQFSPDGRLLAYVSDEQGQAEVFVTTVPPSGAIWQISNGGATMPRWRRDGSELFFRATDGSLQAVELGAGAGAAAIEGRAAPRRLFAGIPTSGNTALYTYTVADDGQRFLVSASRSSARPPITLVVNWQSALGKRAHGGAP